MTPSLAKPQTNIELYVNSGRTLISRAYDLWLSPFGVLPESTTQSLAPSALLPVGLLVVTRSRESRKGFLEYLLYSEQ